MGRAAEWISPDRGNEAEADLVRIVFRSARPEKNSPKIDLVKLSVVDDDKVDADVVTSLKDFDVRRLVVDVVNKKDVKKVENIFFNCQVLLCPLMVVQLMMLIDPFLKP